MHGTKTKLAALLLVSCGLAAAGGVSAQCMLANPSFELWGSGGSVFAGWNQFGSVGASSRATHGAWAARVSGPNTQSWAMSGYWQPLEAVPGERWAVSAIVSHSAARPLTGQSQAIVNVEWRDAGGALISYESHVAADAATPRDAFKVIAFTSQPAPAGTAAARIVLGVLQSPTDPVPDVFYDQVTFDRLGSPSLDEKQWLDFAGGRTLAFSGRDWRVKGPGYYGPGPSLFSNSASSVWVDEAGRLHLTVRSVSGSWYSTEVALADPLGYGDYVFTTRGRLDTLDPKVVFGMFTWQYGACYDAGNAWWNPYNEIDVEFSRWGYAGNPTGQFVAQPFDYPGNLEQINPTFSAGEVTSHAFRWLPNRVEYRSWRGGAGDEAVSPQIAAWMYLGPHIPRPDQPRVHINLWQSGGHPATNQEVVLDAFTFVPACVSPPCGNVAVEAGAGPAPGVMAARPNPFARSTVIHYTAARSGPAQIAVYDLAGRRVRTLVEGDVPAGEHEAVWDGRDESGRRLAAGVFLCRFRMGAEAETRRLVLVK